jgi:hypothetical protein
MESIQSLEYALENGHLQTLLQQFGLPADQNLFGNFFWNS